MIPYLTCGAGDARPSGEADIVGPMGITLMVNIYAKGIIFSWVCIEQYMYAVRNNINNE